MNDALFYGEKSSCDDKKNLSIGLDESKKIRLHKI